MFVSCVVSAKDTVDPTAGVIPNISDHYHALPVLYHFETMPIEKVSDTISRQYIYGSGSMIVKWYFKKGAVVSLHHHVNDQITWITKGSVKVKSQGKVFIVKAGEVIVIPPNVPHEFIALEDTIDVDVFSPARQDWIDKTDQYLQQAPKSKA
jgi:quercetin dioxygenase-like cupin family protein